MFLHILYYVFSALTIAKKGIFYELPGDRNLYIDTDNQRFFCLYIHKDGMTGRDLLVCASNRGRPRRERQRAVPYVTPSTALRSPFLKEEG